MHVLLSKDYNIFISAKAVIFKVCLIVLFSANLVRLVGWLVLKVLSVQTGYIVPQEYEMYYVGLGERQTQ